MKVDRRQLGYTFADSPKLLCIKSRPLDSSFDSLAGPLTSMTIEIVLYHSTGSRGIDWVSTQNLLIFF